MKNKRLAIDFFWHATSLVALSISLASFISCAGGADITDESQFNLNELPLSRDISIDIADECVDRYKQCNGDCIYNIPCGCFGFTEEEAGLPAELNWGVTNNSDRDITLQYLIVAIVDDSAQTTFYEESAVDETVPAGTGRSTLEASCAGVSYDSLTVEIEDAQLWLIVIYADESGALVQSRDVEDFNVEEI